MPSRVRHIDLSSDDVSALGIEGGHVGRIRLAYDPDEIDGQPALDIHLEVLADGEWVHTSPPLPSSDHVMTWIRHLESIATTREPSLRVWMAEWDVLLPGDDA